MAARLSSLVGLSCLAVANCGGGASTSGDSSSTASITSSRHDSPPSSMSATTTTMTATTTTATTATTTTMTATTTTATTTTATSTTAVSTIASTTATSTPLIELALTFPAGSIHADADDLFVLGVDGDLALHPDAFGTGTGHGGSIRLVDHRDPREPVPEGPGPNVIEDVAGVIHGSVVYGECCEPISGTVYAVTEPEGEETPIVDGYSPNVSPDGGRRLAVANDFMLTVVATATGSGIGLQLNQGDHSLGSYRNVSDVQWLSNDEVAVLFWTEDVGYQVAVYEADTLVEVRSAPLGIERDLGLDQLVRFAGLGPDGSLAVVVPGADATQIRLFDPASLAESSSQPGRALPSGVASVALAADGVGLLWVDDATVFFLGAGSFEATPLATNALAAWFVQYA